MRNQFVEVGNVLRFVTAIDQLNVRGAPEKKIVIATGDAGRGKSRTGVWWGTKEGAVQVSVKPAATASWVLSDLVKELGVTPRRGVPTLYDQAVGALAREPRPIVVDEVEHALRNDIEALDTLRQLSDFCMVPLILIGREQTAEKLRRHRQIWTRVRAVVEFEKLNIDDVRLLVSRLVEGEVDDEVVAEILSVSDGSIRNAMTALALVDVQARKHAGRAVTMADIGNLQVVHGARRRASNVIPLVGGDRQ